MGSIAETVWAGWSSLARMGVTRPFTDNPGRWRDVPNVAVLLRDLCDLRGSRTGVRHPI